MSNWKNKINVATVAAPAAPAAPAGDPVTANDLYAAADRFDARTDDFAAGKGAICRDIANRVYKWGFASDKQRDYAVKLIGWSKPRAEAPVNAVIAEDLAALHAAVTRWEARGDVAKADICRDMAAKLARFGSFASPRQQEFARVLMNVPAPVALPGTPSAIAPEAPVESKFRKLDNSLAVPKLFAVMQEHATFHLGDMKISRKNQDSLCWIVWKGLVIGKIDNGLAFVWPNKAPAVAFEIVMDLLRELEADPLAAAMKYGKLSGRCCSCGRDLTDPESIERGIGPICAEKFA